MSCGWKKILEEKEPHINTLCWQMIGENTQVETNVFLSKASEDALTEGIPKRMSKRRHATLNALKTFFFCIWWRTFPNRSSLRNPSCCYHFRKKMSLWMQAVEGRKYGALEKHLQNTSKSKRWKTAPAGQSCFQLCALSPTILNDGRSVSKGDLLKAILPFLGKSSLLFVV